MKWILGAALLTLAGCDASLAVERKREALQLEPGGCPFYVPVEETRDGGTRPTGFYGQLVGEDARCLAGRYVGVLSRAGVEPATVVAADDIGAYRVDVAPGDWLTCVGELDGESFRPSGTCTRVRVGARPERHDFLATRAGGVWQ